MRDLIFQDRNTSGIHPQGFINKYIYNFPNQRTSRLNRPGLPSTDWGTDTDFSSQESSCRPLAAQVFMDLGCYLSLLLIYFGVLFL